MSASFPASSRPDAPETTGPRASTRPTTVVGVLAGASAALLGLAVCGALGLVGWYLSDAGSHGDPSQGVAVGVRGWLVGHGAGLRVDGVEVTLLPLALTLGLAWLVWQAGLRLGELVWDHGPDEARRGDGERDFTLVRAIGGFAVGYVGMALVASAWAGDGAEGSTGDVFRWAVLLVVLLAAPGVALGTGRAQTWIERAPVVLRDAFGGAGRILVAWLAVSAAVFLVALALGAGDARSTLDRLGTSGAESFLLVLGCLLLVPQAVLWSSAFLLGPGFTVGTGTVVAPSGVLLGPLPLLPILGALPDEGELGGVWAAHLAVPTLVAAWIVARRHARVGLVRWEGSLVAGAGAGALAALMLAFVTSLADGAAGPGRLAEVGASAGEVLLAALPAFVLGGLAGAALGTWWARRRPQPGASATAPDDATASAASDDAAAGDAAGDREPTREVVVTPRTTAELAAAKAAATGVGVRPPTVSTAPAVTVPAGPTTDVDSTPDNDSTPDDDSTPDGPDDGEDLDATQEVVLEQPVPEQPVQVAGDETDADETDVEEPDAAEPAEAETAEAEGSSEAITPELDPDLEVTAEVVLGEVVASEDEEPSPS